MFDWLLQYVLGYCTWLGLAAIGEPPLTESLPPDCRRIHGQSPQFGTSQDRNELKENMPIWITLIFFALAAGRYIFSFLIAYVFQVISTVLMVSSADDTSILAAAYALKHPLAAARGNRSSPRTRNSLSEKLEPHPKPLKRSLTRQMTMPIESLGKKLFNLPYLRGLSAFLMISITQWYFITICDFFLSGHPKELKPGYGSTSIILAVFFGGSFALLTHHALTRPRESGNIYQSLPQGQDIIVELYLITTVWALCEQMVRSLPLALSRTRIFALRQYAWTPELWNTLDATGQRVMLFKFTVLFLFYLVLVAGLSIPASMTLRRIHASMLPQADDAIVPFVHGNPKPRREGEESETHSPGLSISEAWATLNWNAYWRVVRVFVIYWIVNQALHFICWEAYWLLHDLFGADRYASFPSGPTRLTLRFLE